MGDLERQFADKNEKDKQQGQEEKEGLLKNVDALKGDLNRLDKENKDLKNRLRDLDDLRRMLDLER